MGLYGEHGMSTADRTALVVIDVQVSNFKGSAPVFNSVDLLARFLFDSFAMIPSGDVLRRKIIGTLHAPK